MNQPISTELQQHGRPWLRGLHVAITVLILFFGYFASAGFIVYRDGTIRSQVAEGSMLALGGKDAVADYYAKNHDYPRNNEAAGVAEPTAMSGNFVSSVTITNGVITVAYGGPKANAMLPPSATLVFVPGSDGKAVRWSCNSIAGSSVEVKHRPTPCRP